MASKRRPRGKRINPTFFVFCEGQTEEEYVKFLRSVYRIPIEINSKRAGDKISKSFINNYLRTKTRHKKDEIFLMYDLDVEGTLDRLNTIDRILLVSNPCIELWFLLHFRDQRANISTSKCIRALEDSSPNYQKGKLTDNLKRILIDSVNDAILRSEQLNNHDNPSTTVKEFIEHLESAKREKTKANNL